MQRWMGVLPMMWVTHSACAMTPTSSSEALSTACISLCYDMVVESG